MCSDCLIIRAKDFLIITGAIAMVLVIIILIMIVHFIRRIRSGVKKVEQLSAQMQMLSAVPLKFLERWLDEKKTP